MNDNNKDVLFKNNYTNITITKNIKKIIINNS